MIGYCHQYLSVTL